MTYLLAAFVVFVLVMTGMGLGVIFSNRPIRGSCGGLNALGGEAMESACACGGQAYACVMIKAAPRPPGSKPPASQRELIPMG
jgi:hypothetical protein